MEFIRTEKGLKITIDGNDKKYLAEVKEDNNDELVSDKAETEFFDIFVH